MQSNILTSNICNFMLHFLLTASRLISDLESLIKEKEGKAKYFMEITQLFMYCNMLGEPIKNVMIK
jgi:hypothetical protein